MFGLTLSKQGCDRKFRKDGQTSTVMFRRMLWWKEDGYKKSCMILAGQMKTKCQGCNKEEGTEKHRLYQCPCWKEVRGQVTEELEKCEQRARTSKKDRRWQRGITTHPLSESQWVMSHFSVREWESKSIRAGSSSARLSGSRCYKWFNLECRGTIG